MRESIIKLVNQEMEDVFLEFCRLGEILEKRDKHANNYIIIRLVTIIEQFFRQIVEQRLKEPKFLAKINSIKNINRTVFMEIGERNKERLIASTLPLQNTTIIEEIMSDLGIKNVFGLKQNLDQRDEFENLFSLRHDIVHSVLPHDGDVKIYYNSTKDLMQNVSDVVYGNPNYFYVNIGNAHARLYQYETAMKYYEDAINNDPTDIIPLINKGIALGKQDEFDNAMKCFDKAIKQDPTRSDSYINKGFFLLRYKYDDALKCFNDAIAVDKMSSAYAYKARLLANNGCHKEALPCYDKAIAVDPTNLTLVANKAHSLVLLGNLEEAADYLFIAISRFDKKRDSGSGISYALVVMGNALRRRGKYDEAINNLNKAIEIDPNNSDAYGEKGYVLRAQGKDDEAKKYFEMVINISQSKSGE